MTFSLGPARVGASIATCASVERDVFAYVDGELAPAAAADVTIHLARCGACRTRVLAAERLVTRARGAARPIAAPPALRARVRGLFATWHRAAE